MKFLSTVFGLGNPTNFLASMILMLIGLIILGDGEIGIRATPLQRS